MITAQLDLIAKNVGDLNISEHQRKANCHAYLHEAHAVLFKLLQSRKPHDVETVVSKIGGHVDDHFLSFARRPQSDFPAYAQARPEVTAFGVNAMQIVTDFVQKLMPDADGSPLKNSFVRAGFNARGLTPSTRIDSVLTTLVNVAANEAEPLAFRLDAFSHIDTLRYAAERMGHALNERALIKPFEGLYHHDHRKVANELALRGWDR